MAYPKILGLIFRRETWTGVATGIAGNLSIGLATADPGTIGATPASEAAYTSYARISVAATSAKWEDNGSDGIQNVDTESFPAKTGGSDETVTHWFVVDNDGKIIVAASLASSRLISDGDTPEFAAGELDTTADT